MCTSKQDIYNIKQLIRTKCKHPFIEKYIDQPMIDLEKVMLIHHIYNHINISEEQKRQYMTTIMLIEIALETHEHVPIQTESKRDEIEKQLTVLAGDYYSGLYYLLLSELEDIDMIQVLANAIKYINEYKMTLYYKEVDSLEQLKLTIKKIESLLFTNVASYLNESMIIPVIEEWLLLNRLVKERGLILQKKDSIFIRYMNNNMTNNQYHSTIDLVDREIASTVHTLKNLLNDIPLHLIGLKTDILESLMKKMYKTKSPSMVEEG